MRKWSRSVSANRDLAAVFGDESCGGAMANAMKPDKARAGTCRKLSVTLEDGTPHVALFGFTR